MVMMLEVAATVAPSWHRYVTGLTRDDPDRVASEAEAEQLVDGIAAIVSSLPRACNSAESISMNVEKSSRVLSGKLS